MRVALVMLLALAPLGGCYLSHEPRAPGEPACAASAPDPDLGLDARPSEYPEAHDWAAAPPEIGDGDPCCTLGPVHSFAVETTSLGRSVSIAWGPGRWGLMHAPIIRDTPALVFEVDRGGAPLGAPHEIDRPGAFGASLQWAEGCWAVAAPSADTRGDVREWYARLYDSELRSVGEWVPIGRSTYLQAAVARLTSGDRWIAVRNDRSQIALTPFSTRIADGEVGAIATPGTALDAVGLRSRVAVLVARDLEANEVVVVGAPPEYRVLGRVALAPERPRDSALAALGDVVVAVRVRDGDARAEIVDPFAMSLRGPPVTLGVGVVRDGLGSAIDVAGAPRHGVAGACWLTGRSDRGGPTAVDFRLVGADGVPRGRPVRIAERDMHGATCAVGSDGEGFLVAWWDGDTLSARRVDVAR
jgi:hypothetical protein